MASKKLSKKKKKDKKPKGKSSLLRSETKKSILAVVFFALAFLSFLSFFAKAGVFGEYFLKISKFLFGSGFFFVAASFILAGVSLLLPRLSAKARKASCKTTFLGLLFFILSVLGIFYIFGAKNILDADGSVIRSAYNSGLENGGYVGLISGYILARYFGFWAGLIVLAALFIISILVSFNIPLLPQLGKDEEKPGENKLEGKILANGQEKLALLAGQAEKTGLWQRIKGKAKDKTEPGKDNKANTSAPAFSSAAKKEESKKLEFQATAESFAKIDSDFSFPSLDLLEEDQGRPMSGDIKANLNIIKRTLENFGIEVEMGDVNVGPTVTQYTLRPAQGIKLARITALQNDMALALAAHPLRIEAPIPGRSLVGIEIPNKSIVTVRLRTLLESVEQDDLKRGLTFTLGRNVAGNPVLANLCKMPHMLVAGATGTGKTITLNSIIVSLIYNNSPKVLKLILIDPKRVELTAYESIPHLMSPVIVTPDKAVGALRWAVSEMERRFEILQMARKRDLDSYNLTVSQSGSKKTGSLEEEREYLPYIVIIVDELADLMASYGREAEAGIVRLAQMARAVGLHLIVSTQRPSVDVITGLIKANITSRIALQVASQIDSRTILDMAGAEKLLGNGDMLFLSGNSAKPVRVQGAYISDKEVKRVTDFLRKAGQPDYKEGVTVPTAPSAAPFVSSGTGFGGAGFDNSQGMDDELYDDAKNVVIQNKRASASLLQRRLRVGYARAARLLDILEERGVVGPSEGAKPRNVFIDEGEQAPDSPD